MPGPTPAAERWRPERRRDRRSMRGDPIRRRSALDRVSVGNSHGPPDRVPPLRKPSLRRLPFFCMADAAQDVEGALRRVRPGVALGPAPAFLAQLLAQPLIGEQPFEAAGN